MYIRPPISAPDTSQMTALSCPSVYLIGFVYNFFLLMNKRNRGNHDNGNISASEKNRQFGELGSKGLKWNSCSTTINPFCPSLEEKFSF